MKSTKFIISAMLSVASVSAFAQTDMTPEIRFVTPGSDILISGLSDNGLWGVSQKAPTEDGSISTVGASIWNLSSYPYTSVDISHSSGFSGANCISNDGKVIGGTAQLKPAVWRDGEWHMLPTPAGKSQGVVLDMTPDGKYGVGIVRQTAGSMSEDGYMWDLETFEAIELPNKPFIDRTGEDSDQNRLTQISPDGRYIFGVLAFSYVFPRQTTPYIYDRQTDEVTYIGLKQNGKRMTPDPEYLDVIEEASMSADGKYLTGAAYLVKDGTELSANEYNVTFRYNIPEKKLELFDGEFDSDYAGFSIGNSGDIYASFPAVNPYSYAAVRSGNYYYPFLDIFEQVYGMDMASSGVGNTGKPVLMSADEKTMVMYVSPTNCYILKLAETLVEAAKRVELLGSYTASPAAGTTMQAIGSVTLTFGKSVSTSAGNYRKVRLLDEEGNAVATALQSGGLTTNGTQLNIRFRTFTMEEGKKYTLNIPSGVVWVGNDTEMVNPEINIEYIGRADKPVQMVSVTPADDSFVSNVSVLQDPIIMTFDSEVMVNEAEETKPVAYLYREDDTYPSATFQIYGATTADKHQVLVAPLNEVHLYLDTDYRVEIPANAIVDLSGNGGNEAFTLTYHGTYEKQEGDPKIIFQSDCSNYVGFLFHEGDNGTPVAEVASMGFTADTTPWLVVRESEESTDMAFGSHSMYVDGRQSDDWVTTEKLLIRDKTAYLSFQSQSWKKTKTDRLKVYVYESPYDYNALTPDLIEDIRANGHLVYDEEQSPGRREDTLTGEWTDNIVPLAEFAGKEVYICFVNDNKDQSMVMIDNILVAVEIEAVLSFTNSEIVENLDEIEIRGQLRVDENNAKTYKGLTMVLRDSKQNEVSRISDPDVVLDNTKTYSFTFSDKLPLERGKENAYYVDLTMGSDEENSIETSYSSKIRNLTFSPVRRVVLEEYTGRDCPNCPRGLQAIKYIQQYFGERFIPIAIHTYQSDPKGLSVTDYSTYLGLEQVGAPSGRINRGAFSFPMAQNNQTAGYVLTAAELAEGQVPELPLWLDMVNMYNEQLTPVDVKVELVDEGSDWKKANFNVTVTSALDLNNANYRIFGVITENDLEDYQQNGMFRLSDEVLGEWGNGGLYGQPTVFNYRFDHVAKGTWGTSYAGTASLLPNQMKANEEYVVPIALDVPSAVKNIDNCDFVVMIIDENTGDVVNAAVTNASVGVKGINGENADVVVTVANGFVNVAGSGLIQAAAYALDGTMLAAGEGEGNFALDINGYRGVVIVKAVNAGKAASFKLMSF